MTDHVLTEVRAAVPVERETDLLAGFKQILAGPIPDGLLRTELLKGSDGQWRIQTLWRDHAALDAMRQRPQAPSAPTLFKSVGSEPTLTVLDVRAALA
jgi:hypothetical protein